MPMLFDRLQAKDKRTVAYPMHEPWLDVGRPDDLQEANGRLETDNDKFNTIKDLFGWISSSQAIIYCNSLKRVSDLYSAMIKDEFPVCCIHSGMDKEQRNETYNDFKNGKHRVCISSNVTARGIDIQQVSTVINFDIPKCAHTYLHRIGRSGRWGRKGVAINFVTKYDIHIMRGIEQLYETEIKELTQDVVV